MKKSIPFNDYLSHIETQYAGMQQKKRAFEVQLHVLEKQIQSFTSEQAALKTRCINEVVASMISSADWIAINERNTMLAEETAAKIAHEEEAIQKIRSLLDKSNIPEILQGMEHLERDIKFMYQKLNAHNERLHLYNNNQKDAEDYLNSHDAYGLRDWSVEDRKRLEVVLNASFITLFSYVYKKQSFKQAVGLSLHNKTDVLNLLGWVNILDESKAYIAEIQSVVDTLKVDIETKTSELNKLRKLEEHPKYQSLLTDKIIHETEKQRLEALKKQYVTFSHIKHYHDYVKSNLYLFPHIQKSIQERLKNEGRALDNNIQSVKNTLEHTKKALKNITKTVDQLNNAVYRLKGQAKNMTNSQRHRSCVHAEEIDFLESYAVYDIIAEHARDIILDDILDSNHHSYPDYPIEVNVPAVNFEIYRDYSGTTHSASQPSEILPRVPYVDPYQEERSSYGSNHHSFHDRTQDNDPSPSYERPDTSSYGTSSGGWDNE